MNIYLIQEDGDSFCVKANTMMESLKICEDSYISDLGPGDFTNEKDERRYYQDEILQSCTFVAELRN